MNDDIKEFNEEKYVEMLENGELYDYITNLQQENEKLNKENEKWWAIIKDYEQEIKDLCLENSKLEQENERLKNIINELKEWIRDFTIDSDEWYKLIYDERGVYGIENRMILDKIKELEERK